MTVVNSLFKKLVTQIVISQESSTVNNKSPRCSSFKKSYSELYLTRNILQEWTVYVFLSIKLGAFVLSYDIF